MASEPLISRLSYSMSMNSIYRSVENFTTDKLSTNLEPSPNTQSDAKMTFHPRPIPDQGNKGILHSFFSCESEEVTSDAIMYIMNLRSCSSNCQNDETRGPDQTNEISQDVVNVNVASTLTNDTQTITSEDGTGSSSWTSDTNEAYISSCSEESIYSVGMESTTHHQPSVPNHKSKNANISTHLKNLKKQAVKTSQSSLSGSTKRRKSSMAQGYYYRPNDSYSSASRESSMRRRQESQNHHHLHCDGSMESNHGVHKKDKHGLLISSKNIVTHGSHRSEKSRSPIGLSVRPSAQIMPNAPISSDVSTPSTCNLSHTKGMMQFPDHCKQSQTRRMEFEPVRAIQDEPYNFHRNKTLYKDNHLKPIDENGLEMSGSRNNESHISSCPSLSTDVATCSSINTQRCHKLLVPPGRMGLTLKSSKRGPLILSVSSKSVCQTLQAGDTILGVDGEDVSHLSGKVLRRLLRSKSDQFRSILYVPCSEKIRALNVGNDYHNPANGNENCFNGYHSYHNTKSNQSDVQSQSKYQFHHKSTDSSRAIMR